MPISTIGLGSAGAEPGLDLLFEEVLTGDTTVVTFDNIPQDYNDLVIVVQSRTTRSDSFGEGGEVIMEQNQVTSTGSYTAHAYRFGSATGTVTPVSSNSIGRSTADPNSAAGSWGAMTCRLIDYANTARRKCWTSYGFQNRAATSSLSYGWLYVGQKTDNTDAITRLDFSVAYASRQDEDFVSGSTFRVYGVR